MTEYVLLLVGTVLVNNFVLVKFLGLCPFMGVSKKLETAIGMGLATTFVLTLASVCSYLVESYILMPLGIEYLRTMSFILVIAVVVQFTEMVCTKPVQHFIACLAFSCHSLPPTVLYWVLLFSTSTKIIISSSPLSMVLALQLAFHWS